MAAQAILILIDGRREHADAVTGVDAGNVFLRNANQGRWWKQPHLGRPMRAVAVYACGVTIVIKQGRFGSVVWTGRRWKRVANFGCRILGEYIGVRSDSRNIGPAVVAGDAVHFILATQQSGRSHTVMRCMARDAGIAGHRRVTAHQGLGRNGDCRRGVRADCPIRERVDLVAHGACGVMARQAQLPTGAVFDEKIQAHQVCRLHMRVVAGTAFYISTNQSNRAG